MRHFNAGKLAVFELKAPNNRKDDVHVNIISPEKRPNIPYKVVDEGNGRFRLEFTTVEVKQTMSNKNTIKLMVFMFSKLLRAVTN